MPCPHKAPNRGSADCGKIVHFVGGLHTPAGAPVVVLCELTHAERAEMQDRRLSFDDMIDFLGFTFGDSCGA
jgi:hypothetical protein